MNAITLRRGARFAVGVDGGVESRRAVIWAVDHALPGDEVLLVHAWQRSPVTVSSTVTAADERHAAEHLVEREVAHARLLRPHDDVRIDGRAVEGVPEQVLVGVASDTIVIGRCHHSLVTRAIFRPLADRLLHAGTTPVVVVSAGEAN